MSTGGPCTTTAPLAPSIYENIYKFENIETEGEIMKRVLEPDKTFPERMINPNPTGMKNDELTKLYFSQLSDSDINYIYKVYEFDLKMFGYTFTYRNQTYPY